MIHLQQYENTHTCKIFEVDCTCIEEWLNKLWHNHQMKYYAAKKV